MVEGDGVRHFRCLVDGDLDMCFSLQKKLRVVPAAALWCLTWKPADAAAINPNPKVGTT